MTRCYVPPPVREAAPTILGWVAVCLICLGLIGAGIFTVDVWAVTRQLEREAQ